LEEFLDVKEQKPAKPPQDAGQELLDMMDMM
jgi:hypothetical protein